MEDVVALRHRPIMDFEHYSVSLARFFVDANLPVASFAFSPVPFPAFVLLYGPADAFHPNSEAFPWLATQSRNAKRRTVPKELSKVGLAPTTALMLSFTAIN